VSIRRGAHQRSCVTDEGMRFHQQTPPHWQDDTVIDIPPEIPHQQPVAARGTNSRAIAVTCTQHGAVGFTNLMVSKRDGTIVLDPRVAGSCVTLTDHPGRDGRHCPVRPARRMARMSARNSQALHGSPANPRQVRPNCTEVP
jgi:hypothetical protein